MEIIVDEFCGKKYFDKEIGATDWCNKEFPCPKCRKDKLNEKENK